MANLGRPKTLKYSNGRVGVAFLARQGARRCATGIPRSSSAIPHSGSAMPALCALTGGSRWCFVAGREARTTEPAPHLARLPKWTPGRDRGNKSACLSLAGISHRPSTTHADLLAVKGRTPSSRLDVVSATPSPSSGPCPPSQRHLDALATNGGEICGLDFGEMPGTPRMTP